MDGRDILFIDVQHSHVEGGLAVLFLIRRRQVEGGCGGLPLASTSVAFAAGGGWAEGGWAGVWAGGASGRSILQVGVFGVALRPGKIACIYQFPPADSQEIDWERIENLGGSWVVEKTCLSVSEKVCSR